MLSQGKRKLKLGNGQALRSRLPQAGIKKQQTKKPIKGNGRQTPTTTL